uniref:ATF7-interacting protein protein binding domain-containing protein n=1 Tax=Ornithorhynchus anatinus TaxID=9258 RepID=F7GEL8_ORNAN
MDSAEEPQKKVFKARKTMRASDRQQLEAVYKVKEEFLKTDTKLLNGKHENGDSDLNSPLGHPDGAEDRREVNGIAADGPEPEEGRTDSTDTPSPPGPEGPDERTDPASIVKRETPPPGEAVPEQEEGPASKPEDPPLANHKEDSFREPTGSRTPDPGEDGGSPAGEDGAGGGTEPDGETPALGEPVSVHPDPAPGGEKKDTEHPGSEEVISSSVEARPDAEPPGDAPGSDRGDSPGQDGDGDDPMETDEIIPILEKLAPAEDQLTCFTKETLLPAGTGAGAGAEEEEEEEEIEEAASLSSGLEDRLDSSLGSPSKQDTSESLPKEAFLVLSDEEEPVGEKEAEEERPGTIEENPTEEAASEEKDKEDKEEDEPKEDEKPPEKNEASRRKRSKSEDMDSIHSKRRRYVGEEYEAELQVKITAREDINQKLQKVVQRLLDEKLGALQCAVFDKALADLKTRVEKIECNKRHKTVLTELQAKIARLTKRFGAAKEDLKKRQQNPPNPPPSPGKCTSEAVGVNTLTYRNAGTVRQMLESKRNVGENAPAPFPVPVNTGNGVTPTPGPEMGVVAEGERGGGWKTSPRTGIAQSVDGIY